jgi:hypothetical protein
MRLLWVMAVHQQAVGRALDEEVLGVAAAPQVWGRGPWWWWECQLSD